LFHRLTIRGIGMPPPPRRHPHSGTAEAATGGHLAFCKMSIPSLDRAHYRHAGKRAARSRPDLRLTAGTPPMS
jgi:hypothetical protein